MNRIFARITLQQTIRRPIRYFCVPRIHEVARLFVPWSKGGRKEARFVFQGSGWTRADFGRCGVRHDGRTDTRQERVVCRTTVAGQAAAERETAKGTARHFRSRKSGDVKSRKGTVGDRTVYTVLSSRGGFWAQWFFLPFFIDRLFPNEVESFYLQPFRASCLNFKVEVA